MQVNSEDITVAWGEAPHPLDAQYGKWRMAVFQDVQESIDGTKLYFLYDPQDDEALHLCWSPRRKCTDTLALTSPQTLTVSEEYICSMREDQPEIVVMANPGLQVWRINCMAESAQPPVAQFTVPGADLTQFPYGLMNDGKLIFLSATPDGHFDNTRVHMLSLNNPQHIISQNCSRDPQRGMPIPRKQCGFDSVTNAILMAGGEVDCGNGFERLVDYWVLNTQTFQWLQVPSQMPCPLNEPCFTACHSGTIYVWGDFDQPLPGTQQHGTHLRNLRVSGLEKASHPPAYSTYNPAPPACCLLHVQANSYVCLSCHQTSGCQVERGRRVASKPMNHQEAARHLTSRSCQARRKDSASKTTNVFIFRLLATGRLISSKMFVNFGGKFDYEKFKKTVHTYTIVLPKWICNVDVQEVSRKKLADDISRVATLALTACEDTNKQLADLDEEVQITPIVVKLAGAIRNTMALASESRMFAKNILTGDEELIRSNDRLHRETTGTFMKVREVTYNLITVWNENCHTMKYPKKIPEDNHEIASLQKLENPFPAHLHLSIKLQPRFGVVVRDIQDSRGSYSPDIGSIIAYALSAVDYNKIPEPADTVSMDSPNSSIRDSMTDDGENLASSQHLEVEFEDESSSYYVKMFYTEKFRKLRELLIAEGEETFIRSLSNSTFWTPPGGKSGSCFYRTKDDRFVIKQMSRFEIQSFVKFAPNFFVYLITSSAESKLTTLCKVYGVFRIGYKSKTTTLKMDILVMEYLFYNHNVSQVWHLKGSLRNRMASTRKSPTEMVLLDANFVKDLWNQQLYVLSHSKAAMNQAIINDSHFLSSQYIMDYSLLVGVDDDNGELILGIVDYMYTLDKKLESCVKIVAIPGAHLPTTLSPEVYCACFSEAIDSYFPVVPDQ
ncbi:hypothetical protein CAEBREN_22105 [Caenorhabditis brenneri]|uniref:PIPK domain-containing protein n=1 Tax=Caenorhabditis brenneri TaxID=135651 RepID=G0NBC3_CAEBE|nr:hypothetical protein CAEBREN_22105 [Caenorhabditis brenneri]